MANWQSIVRRPRVIRNVAWIPVALLAVCLIAVVPDSALAEDGALRWFHTYNVPGGYAVGGIDVVPLSFKDGLRTRRIRMGNQVPPNAEILAAFLYWETMWKGPDEELQTLRRQVQFRGFPVSGIKSSTQRLTPGCRGIGDGERISIMRADVLHLLPLQLDENRNPTGRRLVNDADLSANRLAPHTVTLPDSGIFNFVPQTAGASLLVIYQDPDLAAPLTSIVVYDGLHVQAPGDDTVVPIRGFVDAVDGAAARLTIIGGSGFANLSERVYLGTKRIDHGNPFPAGGLLTDRAWSNPTFDVPARSWTPQLNREFGEQVTARVTHTLPLLLYDCLSTGAVVFSTRTQDSDGDGLADKLEELSGLKNPAGLPYPDIHAMGARADRRDLFVEVGAMYSNGWDLTSRQDPVPGPHNHTPSEAVLKAVSNALLNPPAGHSPIYVHFDVGDRGYQSPSENPNLFVPALLARGGEQIEEKECVPIPDAPPCRFPGFRGVVGWPAGFQFLALAPVGPLGEELGSNPEEEGWCENTADATDCRRRFDLNRDGIFHYLLYAHARGVRKSNLPCLADDGMGNMKPEPYPENKTTCDYPLQDNPEYTTPKSSSGVAELPGHFAMVSLGLWDDFVGTENMQKQTTLHELGHNLGLWHGGPPPVFTPLALGRVRLEVSPNCVPYYWSVMNYINQAAGVVDEKGNPQALLSGQKGPDIDETAVAEGSFGLDTLPFRPSWFAPKVGGTVQNTTGSAVATRHCDGTPLQPGDPQMARLDAHFNPLTRTWEVDWNGDGVTGSAFLQDVNFDGTPQPPPGTVPTLKGHNDWETLTLNRLGFGHAMFELSLGTGLDFGGLDFGGLDFGGLDFGGLDFGGLEYAGLDFGGLDFGGLDFGGLVGGLDFGGLDFGGDVLGLDFGGLDFGGLDFGGLDFGGLDFDSLGQEDPLDPEVTVEIVKEAIAPGGSTAPNAMFACVLGGTDGRPGPNCEPELAFSIAANDLHRHRLTWEAPSVGVPISYNAYRVWDPTGQAETPTPTSLVDFVGNTPGTVQIDRAQLPNGQRFIYWVRGLNRGRNPDQLTEGSLSNFAVVTAENAAPAANNDAGYTLPANTSATFASVLANDTDVDSAPTSLRATLVYGPRYGSLVLNPDGTFVYTPEPKFVGTDTFTYQANNGVFTQGGSSVPMSPNSNTATVTITVTPVREPKVAVKPEKTDVWFTTGKSSTTKFDIKAEVLKNGHVVATGVRANTTLGFGATFDKATYEEIAMVAGSLTYGEEDTLSVRVSIKLSNVEGAPSSAATKLYYNVRTPPGNSSHLHAKRDSTDVKYFMVKAGQGTLALQKNGAVPGPTQVIDVTVTSKTTYTPIATWSVTGP